MNTFLLLTPSFTNCFQLIYTNIKTSPHQKGVPLWCSRLRIWHYNGSGSGGMDLIHGLGASKVLQPKRKKEKKKGHILILLCKPYYYRMWLFLHKVTHTIGNKSNVLYSGEFNILKITILSLTIFCDLAFSCYLI